MTDKKAKQLIKDWMFRDVTSYNIHKDRGRINFRLKGRYQNYSMDYTKSPVEVWCHPDHISGAIPKVTTDIKSDEGVTQ